MSSDDEKTTPSTTTTDNDDSPPDLTSEDAKVTTDKQQDVKESSPTESASNDTSNNEPITNEPDAFDRGQALQIVSIGDASEEYAFQFQNDVWQEILNQVPLNIPVAVVSVVGAFRTGKSFLLSWFLRYLHSKSSSTDGSSKEWYRQLESLGNDGFDWRAGSERNTTGIWMWSTPFIIETNDKTKLAVLLVDTQGMFDHETSMDLTASIFGFSTLLSSYQIYNVDKRIQEDHLQQLALFSEYARTAMRQDDKDNEQEGDEDVNEEAETSNKNDKPFQRMEFLVRDWQHYEEEEEEENPDFDKMIASMQTYLDDVLANRNIKDLQDTREQINSCFEDISCFGLVHPGFAVTKKKYTGDVQDMEPLFLQLLDRLCKRVFDQVHAKSIHGQTLTAVELGSYIKAYAELFASGAHLPTAATLLEATASANNTNAITKAVQVYQDYMDRVSGPKCTNYLSPEELEKENEMVKQQSLRVFNNTATFGSTKNINEAKSKLFEQIDERYNMYSSLNEGRNPLLGLETYLIPIVIAITAVVLRWLTDATCSPYSTVCQVGSEFLSHIYAVVFSFLAIIAATKFKQIMVVIKRVQKSLEVLMAAPPQKQKAKAE